MDNQKQIEEMKKDIAIRMSMAKGVAGSMNNGVEGWLSEYLIERGWAKIPEGARIFIPDGQIVVLSRAEYVSLVTRPGLNTAINVFDVRKETAEKFAERLKEYVIDDFSEYDYGYLCMKIDKICKEFTGEN